MSLALLHNLPQYVTSCKGKVFRFEKSRPESVAGTKISHCNFSFDQSPITDIVIKIINTFSNIKGILSPQDANTGLLK